MSDTPEDVKVELPSVDGVEVFGPPDQPVMDSAEAAEARP